MVEQSFLNFSKSFEYVKANFSIMWLKVTEYKVNFYTTILGSFIWFPMAYLTLFVIGIVLIDILNWSLIDYFVFFMLTDLIGVIGRFFAEKDLKMTLLSGDMNFYLTKPIKPFFGYYFSNYNPGIFVGIFISLIINIIFHLLYFGQYHYNLVFFGTIFLLIVMESLFIMFVQSFHFFLKELKLEVIVNELKYGFLMRIPYDLIKDIKYSNILFLFPFYFVGSLLMPILKEQSIDNLYFQMLLMIGLCLAFILMIWSNWHYGLKKYEGFG